MRVELLFAGTSEILSPRNSDCFGQKTVFRGGRKAKSFSPFCSKLQYWKTSLTTGAFFPTLSFRNRAKTRLWREAPAMILILSLLHHHTKCCLKRKIRKMILTWVCTEYIHQRKTFNLIFRCMHAF